MTRPLRTEVAIIGGGPAGLLLGRKLLQSGIDCVILERRSRAHVLGRIRAGVLESGTVAQLTAAEVGNRLVTEGHVHAGCTLARNETLLRIDFTALAGTPVHVYGQTEVTADLYRALDGDGAEILHDCTAQDIEDIDSAPCVSASVNGRDPCTINCDFAVACDGSHGIGRALIDRHIGTGVEYGYPFGWLGVLSETEPVDDELIYASGDRGFALASMRTPTLSRYYIQVPLTARVEDWSDARFWAELKTRLPTSVATRLTTGPSVEKSIAPLRSYVSKSLQHGRLLLCGDAGHIVPPTGAKGLNLAASDVHYAHQALVARIRHGDESRFDCYSTTALKRVWKASRFSWWMTNLLHRIDGQTLFDRMMQQSEFDHLCTTRSMQQVFAENYTGLPY